MAMADSNVIRFLDHDKFRKDSLPGVPKIIKSGISENMVFHPASPRFTLVDVCVTLLYDMGRDDWIEKMIDVKGTPDFNIKISSEQSYYAPFYCNRSGNNLEVGFSNDGRRQHSAIRYYVDADSGICTPLEVRQMWENWHTHDLSAHEKETCQTVAIGVWAQGRARSAHAVEVSYTGMSVSETETNIEWLRKYKADMIAKGEQEEAEEAQIKERCKGKTQAEFLAETEPCKAGCGKKGRKHLCSQCRMVYYCDKVCQKEDWQFHKLVCGPKATYKINGYEIKVHRPLKA